MDEVTSRGAALPKLNADHGDNTDYPGIDGHGDTDARIDGNAFLFGDDLSPLPFSGDDFPPSQDGSVCSQSPLLAEESFVRRINERAADDSLYSEMDEACLAAPSLDDPSEPSTPTLADRAIFF